MLIAVEEYVRPDGSCPYRGWFDSLDSQAAAKITVAKVRLELPGGHPNSPTCGHLKIPHL